MNIRKRNILFTSIHIKNKFNLVQSVFLKAYENMGQLVSYLTD